MCHYIYIPPANNLIFGEIVNICWILMNWFWYDRHVIEEFPLRWCHNGCDSVSNHQPHDCLLNRLFRRRSKKTSLFCLTGLCVGNSQGTDDFPAQMASNAENFSISWSHHEISKKGGETNVNTIKRSILFTDRFQVFTLQMGIVIFFSLQPFSHSMILSAKYFWKYFVDYTKVIFCKGVSIVVTLKICVERWHNGIWKPGL